MNKNEIIEKIVIGMLAQRKTLIDELTELNFNETSFFERRLTLENAITQIDMKLDNLIFNCQATND